MMGEGHSLGRLRFCRSSLPAFRLLSLLWVWENWCSHFVSSFQCSSCSAEKKDSNHSFKPGRERSWCNCPGNQAENWYLITHVVSSPSRYFSMMCRCVPGPCYSLNESGSGFATDVAICRLLSQLIKTLLLSWDCSCKGNVTKQLGNSMHLFFISAP